MAQDFIEQMAPLMDAADEKAWFGAMAGLAETCGFRNILLAVLPRPALRQEDAYLRSTYAPAWHQAYEEQGMIQIDPTVSHCATRSAPLVWAPEIFSTEPQKSMYETACAHGLRTGVILPIHGPNQQAGMMCFIDDSEPTEEFRRHIRSALPNLTLLRDHVIDTSARYLICQADTPLPKLTPRERECLKWTARGKSTWETSQILNCSEAVVNFHMKNIRTKFGVNSRRAAAVIATQLGLIDPD